MAWYPCGCCRRCPCERRRPDVVPVTFSGFVNGTCSCTFLNATLLLPLVTVSTHPPGELGNHCMWGKAYDCSLPSGGPVVLWVSATVAYAFIGGAPTTYWVVDVMQGFDRIAQFYKAITLTDYKIDCDATRTLDLVGSGTLFCDGSNATCQVN